MLQKAPRISVGFWGRKFKFQLFYFIDWFLFCTERVHLSPRGPGGRPDRQCLLGALLPWARCWSRWRLPGRSCRTKLPWRPIQHFLQHWEFWASRPTSPLCGPGAHGDRWVDLRVCSDRPYLALITASLSPDWEHWYPSNRCSECWITSTGVLCK